MTTGGRSCGGNRSRPGTGCRGVAVHEQAQETGDREAELHRLGALIHDAPEVHRRARFAGMEMAFERRELGGLMLRDHHRPEMTGQRRREREQARQGEADHEGLPRELQMTAA